LELNDCSLLKIGCGTERQKSEKIESKQIRKKGSPSEKSRKEGT
jgi:hypothetical protein